MKQKTKISLLFTFSAALITPIIIVNQINIDNHKQQIYQKSSKNLLSNNINTSNLIQLNNNQNQLLKEISSKYDESKLLFKSWKNSINFSINSEYDVTKFEASISKQFVTHSHNATGYPGNFPRYKRTNTFKTETFIDNLAKIRKHQIYGISINPTKGLINNSFKTNISLDEKISFVSESRWENTGYPLYQEKEIQTPIASASIYLEPSDFFNSPYQYPSNLNQKFIQKITDTPLNFSLFSIDGYKQIDDTSFNSILKSNNNFPLLKPHVPHIDCQNGIKDDVLELAETIFLIDEQNNKLNLNEIISFKDQNINWDKFFVLKPSAIDNNGSYYLGANRPALELGLNLPLVNAIDWYGQLPDKFNTIWNVINDIFNKFSDNPFLFNEIFESEENFFDFFNTYLLNIANFSYNWFEFENLTLFFNELNTTEPSELIRKSIKELMASKKDIKYNNITIPANVLNTENNIKSGSDFNSKMLKDYLKINSFNFKIKTPNNALWKPKEFENNKIINQWNAYSDVILPIILSQDISVSYTDHFGNENARKAYDAASKQFIPDAIKPAAVLDDFDTPYSSVIIKKLMIGKPETRQFLGINTEINSKESFASFANQSLINRTKIIDNKEYVATNPNDWDDSIYVKGTNNGIEVRFRYLTSEKSVEEGAWSKFKDNDKMQPFILIPDEAWGKDEPFDTNPNSTLEEIFNDGIKSKELYERAVVRPFVLKKQITTQDLKDAKIKYLDFTNRDVKMFTKGNIGDFFLTPEFKDKNPNWENIPFSKLSQMKREEVIVGNDFQVGWFENFIKNPKLPNQTFKDFWPKFDEGRFFVICSYKPSIDSTQVKLREEAGFYYAGQQKDGDNQITNFNYIVELEVKNKIYDSKLNQVNLEKDNYQNQNISYTQYLQLINYLANDFSKYFSIKSSRFIEDQIQQPKIQFIPNEDDDFLVSGYGNIKIDYQKSLPIINQVCNDTFTEQLPFDLNNIVGMKKFRNAYKDYLIEDLEAYNKLNTSDKESKILLDNKNNQIIIGGKTIALIQNFNVTGIANTNSKDIVVIPTEYLDPRVAIYGFDQKTKKYTSLEEYQKEWNGYDQEQLFDKLFRNYNYNNKAEKLKKIVKDFKVIFSVEISEAYFKVNYQFTDSKTNQTILDTWTLDPLPLTDIRPIKLDAIKKSSFKFGYDQTNDANIPFQLLENELKDINKLASHFNFDSDLEKQNFIRGIKSIDVKLNPETKKISISLTLNDNFVLYDDQSKLNFDILAIEINKVELGNLNLKNMDQLVKNNVAKLSKNEDVLNYLNTLSLDTKKSFFISTNLQTNPKFNLLASENYLNQIQDIIFSFDKKDLVAEVQFKNDNYALAKNDNLRINNFIYNLKVDLGIINPFKDSLTPWVVGVSTAVLVLLSGGIGWLWLRKRKQSRRYLTDTKTHKYDINEANVDFDLKEQLEDNENLSENR